MTYNSWIKSVLVLLLILSVTLVSTCIVFINRTEGQEDFEVTGGMDISRGVEFIGTALVDGTVTLEGFTSIFWVKVETDFSLGEHYDAKIFTQDSLADILYPSRKMRDFEVGGFLYGRHDFGDWGWFEDDHEVIITADLNVKIKSEIDLQTDKSRWGLINIDWTNGEIDSEFIRTIDFLYEIGKTRLGPGESSERIEGTISRNITSDLRILDIPNATVQTNSSFTVDPTNTSIMNGQITSTPTVPVGGLTIPVDKFALLAPYIGLTSTIVVATVATAVYVKRVKRRKEKLKN